MNKIRTYQPLIIIVGYVLIGAVIIPLGTPSIMGAFMGMFFFLFSLFKVLDVPGFAKAYARYDIISERFSTWGYIYPFIELGLGILYLTGFNTPWLHIVTGLLMFIGLIGVSQAVIFKKKITCACLGAGFNLPMSTITIIEDGIMMLMAIWMLLV